MKIVVIAPVHAYDDIRVFRKEAVSLAAAGNEVLLFARTPDDLPLLDRGVDVVPVTYRGRRGRFAALPRLARAALRERADVYHIHNPDTLPIGFLLRLAGRTVIYDTHEDFRAEILLRGWLPRGLRTPAAVAVSLAERLAGRYLDAVIVTQPRLLDRIPGSVVIGNPPIVDEGAARAAAERRERAGTGDPLVLGYVGGISRDRGLFRMIDLVVEINRTRPARLLLIGYPVNDDALELAKDRPGWEFVEYRGQLPQEEAFTALDSADAGLILFADVASHARIDPNKIYEYMTLALPFVATGFPDWIARIGPAAAGLFLPIGEPAGSAARQVITFLSDRARVLRAGRNGVDFVVNEYSWQGAGLPLLLGLYQRVTGRSPGADDLVGRRRLRG